MLCFTETWLGPDKPDAAIIPPGFTVYRKDRSAESSKKRVCMGGGVCFMINNRWCNDVTVVSESCSPVLEHLTLSCRPFYSPREFSSIVLVAAYIPPRANSTAAIGDLVTEIHKAETAFPNSALIVVGDFNHTNLRKGLPRYYQHVACPTRQDKTLDHCYTTIEGAYRATPRAPLGDSDHALVVLTPMYKQKLKSVRPVNRSVKMWSQDAIVNLQGCLDCTAWDIFKSSCSSLDEYTDTVACYISFCEEVCVPIRKIKKFGNDKPWFSKSVKAKSVAKNEAFRAGGVAKYRLAKSGVWREVRRAKAQY